MSDRRSSVVKPREAGSKTSGRTELQDHPRSRESIDLTLPGTDKPKRLALDLPRSGGVIPCVVLSGFTRQHFAV